MPVRIIQTADPFRYREMLEATARTCVEYARRHGHSYEAYIGIKRGSQSLHAAFNRMFLLRELHDSGYRGWALYMDADAYVWDLDFDLDAYLADKADCSAVMATIDLQPIPWSINSGVLLFNMTHPLCRPLLDEWMAQLTAVDDERFESISSVWDDLNDQGMLWTTLDQNPALRERVFFEQSIKLNHKDGHFIRQFLGAFEADIVRRTAMVQWEVAYRLRGTAASRADDKTPEWLISDAYCRILRRDPDEAGLHHYLSMIQAFGPSRAVTEMERQMLGSPEYQARIGGNDNQ
jgi:hypothetical protein